jgi:hypothetical protein
MQRFACACKAEIRLFSTETGSIAAMMPCAIATRELVCGGFTGGGSHNPAAWAMSSGFWAAPGASEHAHRTRIAQRVRRTGGVALNDNGHHEIDPAALVRAVQAEVFN